MAGSLASGMGGGEGGKVVQPRANGRNDFDEGLALRGTCKQGRIGQAPVQALGLAEPEGAGPFAARSHTVITTSGPQAS